MPALGALVALRMEPNNGRATFYKVERFDIGRFKTEKGGRKVWWHSTRGTSDPARLRKHYDIWWCSVPEFDGV